MQEIREIEPLALVLAQPLLTLQATGCWRSRRRALCWEAGRGGGEGSWGLKSYSRACAAAHLSVEALGPDVLLGVLLAVRCVL